MIYFTGDIHGDMDITKLSNKNWKEQKNLTAEDYLVICGDFGLPFFNDDREKIHGSYRYWIKWLARKPYTILWVDGNHENFNFWDMQEVTMWHGGRVQIHPDAPNVIHLMRGEVYTDVDGKTILAFGGAASIDRGYRKENITWWRQEQATKEDFDNAIKNLEKVDFKVDYIISHTLSHRILKRFPNYIDVTKDMTEYYLQDISIIVDYCRWFCGHFHIDRIIPEERIVMLYNKIVDSERIPLMKRI